MKLLKNGKTLSLVIGLLPLSGCPSIHQDPPPVIEICIADGHGGADCIERDNTKLYRAPSQMKNYWCTNQEDEAAFAGWAYGASKEDAKSVMEQIQSEVQK